MELNQQLYCFETWLLILDLIGIQFRNREEQTKEILSRALQIQRAHAAVAIIITILARAMEIWLCFAFWNQKEGKQDYVGKQK